MSYYGENLFLFFGLPGCGKTTLLCSMALKHLINGANVYTNIPLAIDNPNYHIISNSDIGKYNLHNGVLLIDEGTLFANNRDYKKFSRDLTEFFMLHRHYGLDIYIFAQTFDGVDKKIRTIATSLFYVKKSIFGTTYYYRIPYGLSIPNKKMLKVTGAKYGDINEGYCDATLFQKIFSPRIVRQKYYRYFDSYDAPKLPDLPNSTKNSTANNISTKNCTVANNISTENCTANISSTENCTANISSTENCTANISSTENCTANNISTKNSTANNISTKNSTAERLAQKIIMAQLEKIAKDHNYYK